MSDQRPSRLASPALCALAIVWLAINASDAISAAPVPFGQDGDRPVPGRYVSRFVVNHAVWRSSDGTWHVRLSNGQERVTQWGLTGDKPVPADYDGDGLTDYAVYREAKCAYPCESGWFIVRSSNGQQTARNWGLKEDIPVPGDYDGDGKTDLAVWRPSTGVWHYVASSTGGHEQVQWGTMNDVPVPMHTGGGRTDFVVYRPGNFTWYWRENPSGVSYSFDFGFKNVIPFAMDICGYGDEPVLFHKLTGVWWFLNSSSIQYGTAGDEPVPAAFLTGAGAREDVAVWRPSNATWYVIPSNIPCLN